MTESAVKTLLRPYPDQAMAFWAVDRRVGNVRNDSPDLFAPLRPARRNDMSAGNKQILSRRSASYMT